MSGGREAAYLAELTGRLRAALRHGLLGVHLMGSAAAGDDVPGVSDLDVWAIVGPPLDPRAGRALAARVDHRALPCPARGLELVVARLDGWRPDVQLDLNDGPAMRRRVAVTRSRLAASHWYVLDLAVGRERSVPLWGPPLAALAPPVPRSAQLAAVRRSLAWHRRHAPDGPDAVLNALRGARYALEGTWSTKGEAAAWAQRERPAWAAEARAAHAARLARRGTLS